MSRLGLGILGIKSPAFNSSRRQSAKKKGLAFRPTPPPKKQKLPPYIHTRLSYWLPEKKAIGKRIFDIVFSLCFLFFAFPLFLIIYCAIRATSPGGAIYSQTRAGKEGRPFKCYKFRTMYVDAESRLAYILQSRPDLAQEWQSWQKLRHDPRVTGKIGYFLRKTSLDELPQFWNVLKGELSVVGPRPLLPCEIHERLRDKAYKILSVKPGLTGLWQTSGRSNLISYEERIAMDEEYVEKRSFLLDIKLICKTIPCMFFFKGV